MKSFIVLSRSPRFLLLLCCLLVGASPSFGQYTGMSPYLPERGGLMINEVSNGPTGQTQEYVEFVVIGAPTSPSDSVDIRGWIMDDNNFAASGQGNAPGHLVFGDCYDSIAPGSILVVYNADDPNPALPPDDPFDDDGNGVFIIPHNHPCMDACFSNPSFTNPLFCPCDGGISNPIAWQFGLRNEGDVVQLRNPCETVTQAIHWGGVSLTNDILDAPMQFSFPDPQTGRLFRCHNTFNQDYHDPTNWDNPDVVGNESPGIANSPENADMIASMQLGTYFSIGLIWDCRDTDAGDITPPMDAINGLAPVQICQGDDLTAFGTTYVANDEEIPNAIGFSYEYAYLLSESLPPYSILDVNLDGDFDLSPLAVGTYLVWGFSYIQTNGSVSVIEFLNTEGSSIQNIQDFTGCGYHSDLDNVDLSGLPMQIEVLSPPQANLPMDLPASCQTGSTASFDLISLEEEITGGSGLAVLWYEDPGLSIPLADPQNFTVSSSTLVYAQVSNGVCPNAVVEVPVSLYEAVSVSLALPQGILCAGDDNAVISSSIQGGQSPYLYTWNDISLSGPTVENLSPGTYHLTVTDANGCSGTDSIVIAEPEVLNLSCSVINDVSQFGGSDGQAQLDVQGGTPPLNLSWSGPISGQSTLFMDESIILSNIMAGDYNVLITDANGCSSTCTFTVNQPPCGLSLSAAVEDPTCAGVDNGQINLNIESGLPPYSFTWNNGVLTEDIANLSAGNYIVTVTDQAGCTLVQSFVLEAPAAIEFQAIALPPICFEDAVGSIRIDSLFGGKPPYQYSLDGADLVPILSQPLVLNNIAPGAYTLSIEDAQGCFELIELEMEAPEELQLDLGNDQTILLGASVEINVLTNFPPISYEWSSDLDGLFLWEESSLRISPEETTVFKVIATDEDGCQVEDRVTIFVNRERQVYIPNGFSPNDDGQNDRFSIFSGPDVLEIQSLRVFNRWGGMVYEATNIAANDEPNGWDGTFRGRNLNSGVYIYVAEIRFVDGITEVFKGDVTLLR